VLSWLAGEGNRLARLERLRWVWFSSPLVRPSHRQPRLKIAVATALARAFPRMTLSNGVRASDCYHMGRRSAAESDFSSDGGHHRVSLRFATSLLAAEAGLLDRARSLPPGLACLVTQGAEDGICPPECTEGFYRSLNVRVKTLLFVSGARHEPFREDGSEGVTHSVAAWLASRA